MSETHIKPAEPLSVEEGVNALLCDAQQSIRHGFEECERHIRKSPTTSVLAAAAVGYCLHRLPVRAVLVVQVRLLAALAPPALFLFGAAKACEYLQRQAAARPR
jgi:hypothetical protein